MYSGYYVTDELGKLLEKRIPDPHFKGRIFEKLLTDSNNICGGTLMVEKAKLIEVGLFDPELGGAENLDLRIRLSRLGNVYYCPEPLYYYQRHSESLTGDPEKMDSFHLKILEKHFGKEGSKNRRKWKLLRSRQLYFQGGDYLQRGDCKKSAVKFFQSILLHPQRPRAYVNLLRCFMGSSMNNWLISLKRNKLTPRQLGSICIYKKGDTHKK